MIHYFYRTGTKFLFSIFIDFSSYLVYLLIIEFMIHYFYRTGTKFLFSIFIDFSSYLVYLLISVLI